MAPPVTGIYPSGWNKLIRTIEHAESDHRHRHIGTFKEFVPRLLAQHAGGAGKRFLHAPRHRHPPILLPLAVSRNDLVVFEINILPFQPISVQVVN